MAESGSEQTADRAPTGAITLTVAGVAEGVRRMFWVSLFAIPFGVAVGAAAADRGLSVAQAVVMSATVFAGASQFAALELWAHPMPWVSLALVVFAVNARHIILGAALSPWVNKLPPAQRLLALTFMSDPNFADTRTAFAEGARDVGILLGGGLSLWSLWILGTAVGAIAGGATGSLERFGVDVVMFLFFTATVVATLKTRGGVVPVAVAVVVAVATLDVLPTGWNVILAALVGGLVGAFVRGR